MEEDSSLVVVAVEMMATSRPVALAHTGLHRFLRGLCADYAGGSTRLTTAPGFRLWPPQLHHHHLEGVRRILALTRGGQRLHLEVEKETMMGLRALGAAAITLAVTARCRL